MNRPIPYLNSWKQHVVALVVGLFFLFFIIFQVSIRRTWFVYTQYQNAQDQIVRSATATADLSNYQQRLSQFGPAANQSYNRELLLERVTGFCRKKGLLVTGFPEAQQLEEKGKRIVTNQIEVQGAYKSMVELLYLIEQEEQLGVISSVRFFTVEERGINRQQHLRGAITLRNLLL